MGAVAEKENVSPITYIEGDATAPVGDGLKIIAHIVNDVGRWGAGFVVALSREWKRPEQEYRKWMGKASKNLLGALQLVPVEDDVFVANIVGQHGIGKAPDGTPPIRYEALGQGLKFLAQYIKNHPDKNASVHAPRLGSGLAGGKWPQIEALLLEHLASQGIAVTVYDLPA